MLSYCQAKHRGKPKSFEMPSTWRRVGGQDGVVDGGGQKDHTALVSKKIPRGDQALFELLRRHRFVLREAARDLEVERGDLRPAVRGLLSNNGDCLEAVLKHFGGNYSQIRKDLGPARNTLSGYVKKHGLCPRETKKTPG